MNLPGGFEAALSECFEGALPVKIVLKYDLSPIPAIHKMVNGSRIFQAEFSGHTKNMKLAKTSRQSGNVENRPRSRSFYYRAAPSGRRRASRRCRRAPKDKPFGLYSLKPPPVLPMYSNVSQADKTGASIQPSIARCNAAYPCGCTKYLISITISLALFLIFRRNHDFTLQTWLYLLIIHTPFPAAMFALERARKIKIHPVICFLCTWIGGLVLGFIIGPFLIGMLGRANGG